MASGANDDGFVVLGAKTCERDGGVMGREINDHIALLNDFGQVLAEINPGGHDQAGECFRGPRESLPHFSLCAGDNNSGHDLRMPHCTRDAFRAARFFALNGAKGRRYSSLICPSMAAAALTGTGFGSMNRSLKTG